MATDVSAIDIGPDDSIAPGKGVLLSIQHVLTMLGATIAVPTIIADAIGMDGLETALLISCVMLAMGVSTLVQVLVGSRLPIIQGSSFAFLPAMFVVIGSATLYPREEMLQYIAGGILAGGIVQIAVGLLGLAGALQKVLSPVVIGPTIVMIGLSLFGVGGDAISSHWLIGLLTVALVFAFTHVFPRLSALQQSGVVRQLRLFPVLSAVVFVYGICLALTLSGSVNDASPLFINVHWADAFLRFDSTLVLPWGIPKFSLPVFLAFIVGYLVSMVESIGDYNACNELAYGGQEPLGAKRVNRGIWAEGLGCVTSSLLGGLATTSYSENIGLLGVTRVASRTVVMFAGGVLIVAGLVPNVGAILGSIPNPIMGGLYCVLFGMISGVGLRFLSRSDLSSFRNISIVGFSLFFGLAVSGHFAAAEVPPSDGSFAGFMFSALLGVLKSGMAVTLVSALLLDLVSPASDKERGLGR